MIRRASSRKRVVWSPVAERLGVGVGVERQHLVADEVLDEGERATGGRVVRVGHAARAERPFDGAVIADDPGPDRVNESLDPLLHRRLPSCPAGGPGAWVMIRRLAGKSPARRPQRSPAPEPLPAAPIPVQLVKRFRRGFVLSDGMHDDDFDRALARHHGRIFTFATYLLSSRVEAEDVTQEVFVKLWRSGDAVPPERVGAWLLRVTRNACFDHLRRRRWQRRFTTAAQGDPPPETASDAPGPEVLAAASELGRRLLEALARLGEPHRSIVILRHVEGLSCREIGEVVDMTEGSVRVALHRARRRLREQLREVVDGAAIA